MTANPLDTQVYLPSEVARAAGVAEDEVVAALGRSTEFVGVAEAIAVARQLRAEGRHLVCPPDTLRQANLFSAMTFASSNVAARRLPFAISGTLHAGVLSVVLLVTTFGVSPAATPAVTASGHESVHLVFLDLPGPGGGGGGGGHRELRPAAPARRAGQALIGSTVPEREAPAPAAPEPDLPPAPPEPAPTVSAPVVPVGADLDDRPGMLEQTPAAIPSQGPGTQGGSGSGAGTGLGSGSGTGIGPGSGGGTGGGPYRPGSGITPPRLLREVKATYTEAARRAFITGDVVLEIVVRRDGSVGDVRVRQALGAGLNEQAVAAVRQWRFAPATRQGAPVDVIVEVSVAFSLR